LKETTEFASDLLDEAMLAVRIKHPNVVPVLDVDDDPLGLFLVMEYIEGDTLAGLRRKGLAQSQPLPRNVGLRILLDALAGLHAAHEIKDDAGMPLDLVHRDFSPQNILVGLDGVAKLTDFGIAKASSRLSETRTGLVKGKISYMAPEQARSQMLDRRCDVWAAGVIAWELLSERRLYATDNDVGTLLKVVSEEPPLLRTVAPDLSPEIEAAVKHALTIDLSRRVASAQAFARELSAACQAAGLLADHEQVAGYLATLVGARLRERRRRAAEIVRLRSKLGRVVEASSSDAQSKSVDDVIAEARGPLNVIPEPESSSSDVVLSPPALESITPITPGVPTRSDSIGTVAASVTDAQVIDRAALLDPTAAGLPRYQSRRVALVAGGLLVLGGIVAAIFGSNRSGHTTSTSTSSQVATSTPAASASVDSVPPVVEELPAPPAIATKLVLHANAPLSVVHVDDRVASPRKPAKETTIELTGAEHERTIKLFAATTDGRQATALVPAGATAAMLEFKDAKDIKDTGTAAGTRPPKPPASQKPPTLAPSPYATKP
ncbi:MAG: serine/threonine protein kinase, partial [Myxococcaceae bacterium]|nr:serine/threonine protein kinase [Myxococcaceae bacterium]